jgi:hypothetical protein
MGLLGLKSRRRTMKKVAASLALSLGLFIAQGALADTIDMKTLKCEDFLKMSSESIGSLMMWISGYYANEDEETTIDFDQMKNDGIKIATYCKEHPATGLLDATEKALGRDD